MTAIILVFFLVAALFQRSRLLTKRGGLSLFALVEIATFLAAPGGQDVIGLTGKPDWMAIALALPWRSSWDSRLLSSSLAWWRSP
ncbi:MAG: hypothetical protein IPH27_05170 [Actinomycetales bacterium]|nr:hypothetical protein [Candidatus Phosphoribacter baldrii]